MPCSAKKTPTDVAQGPIWVTAVEHVLAHLAKADLQALRLTARVFRSHPALRALCSAASIPPQQHQAGLCFLQQLPNLQKLDLHDARSLFSVHQLSQLHSLEINGCQQVLDFYGLGQMPQLRELSVSKCPAASLGNLSELSQLTQLDISQLGFHSQVAALTALKLLRIRPTPGLLAANLPSCASLTGLTSLVDNACSREHWHTLPQLVYLEVNTPMGPQALAAIPPLTQLRGLALSLEESITDPMALTPLTVLCLERLELDRPLNVPALSTLTRLTIQYGDEEQPFPEMAALPQLSQIYLYLWGNLDLPDLPVENFPQLSSIRYKDDDGRFTINARDHSRYSLEYVPVMPWIDEDT